MKAIVAHVLANGSEGRLIFLTLRMSRWLFSRAEESVYVITCFCRFKGKENGGSEAPKLRNHCRAEVIEQKLYCVREMETET